MIDNIKNFLKDTEFAITMYKGKVHIFNYESILDINPKQIEVKLYDRVVKITGDELKIVRLDKKELLITGLVKGIDTYGK